MSRPEVVKIFGGPGTGKTTTMVGNSDIADFKGILHRKFDEDNPNNLMLIAYTRAAADTAKERLSKLTSVRKAKLDKRITTIHSLTMGMSGVRPQNIVEIRPPPDKYNFCQEQYLEYGRNDDDDIMTASDEGHTFFRIAGWLKANMLPPSDWIDCPAASDWPHGDDFAAYHNEWEMYKMDRGIWEFDDVILEAVENGSTISARELFVDETQDLYPLQQEFLNNQFEVVDRVWLAGDDDQTIYEWSGAQPDYFVNMEPNVNGIDEKYWDDKSGYWDDDGVYILSQSYRMPAKIMKLSQELIQTVRHRQEKEFEPYQEGGDIRRLGMPTTNQILPLINHDDTFILFRANYQASNFGQKLIDEGIPYTGRFKTWRPSMVKVRDALAAIKNDEPEMKGSQASRLIEEIPNKYLLMPGERSNMMDDLSAESTIAVDNVVNLLTLNKPRTKNQLRRWMDEWRGEDLNWYQQNAIRENLLQDNEDMYPDGLTLETIHWSKGREADTVILSLSTTNTVLANCPPGDLTDAEKRLYYVGMTRTKNRLVLAQGLDDQSPTLTFDDLFGGET